MRKDQTQHGSPVRFASRGLLAPHRHQAAYLALVLRGGYEEQSADGRYMIEAGDIVVHPAFHRHANRFSRSGADVVDYRVEIDRFAAYGVVRAGDPSAILEALREGSLSLNDVPQAPQEEPEPWLADLAARLVGDAPANIAILASRHRVSREHATREFKQWFGIAPGAYRREHRLQRAISKLREGQAPATVAYDEGFADQPHLSRALKRSLGVTAGSLRPSQPD